MGPFEMIGDENAEVCVDGVCAVPRPVEDAERREEDSADAGPGAVDRAPVQR